MVRPFIPLDKLLGDDSHSQSSSECGDGCPARLSTINVCANYLEHRQKCGDRPADSTARCHSSRCDDARDGWAHDLSKIANPCIDSDCANVPNHPPQTISNSQQITSRRSVCIGVVSWLAHTHHPLQDRNSSQALTQCLEGYEAYHPMSPVLAALLR